MTATHRIVVVVDRLFDAEADRVFAALSDYRTVRPRLLPDVIAEYEVVDGGTGDGSRVRYRFSATKRRTRQLDVDVTETEPRRQLLESDRNSSLSTLWTISDAPGHRSRLIVRTEWKGVSGIGGFFERRFAPKGMRRIYTSMLESLADELT